jgi:hypothetical protein
MSELEGFDRCGRHPELGVVTLRQLLATCDRKKSSTNP